MSYIDYFKHLEKEILSSYLDYRFIYGKTKYKVKNK